VSDERRRPKHTLRLRGREVELGVRTLVMGVVNVTPDSFSDGGRHGDPAAAVAHGVRLAGEGADVLDVGGESTRPGADPVPAAEQVRRVVPVLRALRRETSALLSIDTASAVVAETALEAGADLVNDVSGLLWDEGLGEVVARHGVPVVLMHLRGTFAAMHAAPRYGDVMAEVQAELAQAVGRAERAGVSRGQIVLDPGIGFSKQAEQSLAVISRLGELRALGCPVLAGPSRKSFIGRILDAPVEGRLLGTAAAVAACVLNGTHVVRVHDVGAMVQVVRVCDAILSGQVVPQAAAAVERGF
jgi:dihydropteroate synthase